MMQKLRLALSVAVVALPVILLYQSCGITKPRYIEYGEQDAGAAGTEGLTGEATGTADNTTTDPAEVFALKMEPAIEKSCALSSCHGAGSGGLTLTTGQAEANRAALKEFADSAQTLFTKISSASHGGGDQSGNMPLADIEAWFTAEAGGTAGGGKGSDPECPPESIFLAQIQPAIVKSCGSGSCHGGGAGGLTLEAANEKAPTNRTTLYDFEPTSEAIFNKISSSSHGGGDRSADLPKTNIDTWIAGEDACK